jgi:DNA-binding transcriptional MerR regulator
VSAMEELLTIGEVSRRSGVAASALRFYEERGLITSERAGSGHRRYPRSVLRRIAFTVFAQRVGLSLESARSSPSCRQTTHRREPTGHVSPGRGAPGSTNGSPNSNA